MSARGQTQPRAHKRGAFNRFLATWGILGELWDENGPIGAICFKAWDVGGKELDGRNGHYQKNVAAEFVELDLGRAHNL